MVQLMKRYGKYASAKGTSGMPLTTLQNFPEYIGNPLITEVFMLYKDQEKPIIYPEQFLLMCGILSPKASTERKRKRKSQSVRAMYVPVLLFKAYETTWMCLRDVCTKHVSQKDNYVSVAFRIFDVHKVGYLQYEELFRMYKLIFPPR